MPDTVVTPVVTPVVVTPAETAIDEAVMKSFLAKRGITDISQLDGILDTYKGDVTKLKGDNKTLSESQKRLVELEAEAETRRQATLTETQRLTEEGVKKDKDLAELRGKVAGMERSQLKDRVLFKHAKNKPLLGTRVQLYEVAAKSQEWTTEEELQKLYVKVDEDFDAELKAMNISIPAPGDGNVIDQTGKTKYDANFFGNVLSNAGKIIGKK